MVARLVLRTAALAALSGCIGSGKQHAAPDASARGPAASAPPPAPTPPPAANTQPGIDGKALYERYCDFCHGKEGQGYAADEAPALANDVFLSIATDAYIHDAILKGRPGTTMSAWGKQKGGPLDGKDADAIVSYVRAWQKQAPVALTPREPKGDAARGAKTYAAKCAGCHGAKGSGGKYNALGNAELLASASDAFLAATIERGRPGTPMPAFGDKLSHADVDDVLALLRSWQKAPDPNVDLPPKPGKLENVVIHPKGKPASFPEGADFVKVDVVKAAVDAGSSLIIVDARAPGDYATMHVAGAISVPFYTVNDYAAQIPKDRWILTYCACPHAASVKARDALRALGYKNVAVLDEGINVWRDKGYPVRGGSKP